MTITEIANNLEKVYPELNFKNHCYLRIAYDNVVKTKWDTLLDKPFILKANVNQIDEATRLLNMYLSDKKTLLEHNKISLQYRNKKL